ncbi:MAG: YIP1 family protein, partial [Methanomicrobiales archaeon]|nr:YIP1 family protein [Methanomicrobiales archaeon]
IYIPDHFFSEKVKNAEKLTTPVLIVGLIGILSAIAAYLVTQVNVRALIQVLPPESQQMAGGIAMIFGVVGGFLGSYIWWLIASVVFFGLSAMVGSSGNFKRTLKFIGFGFLPQVFGGLINIYFMYEFASTVQIPKITDPILINDVIQSLMNIQNFVLATIVSILFLLWSTNIWIFGLKHARNLSMRDAAICVLVPMVIYILYTLNTTGIFGGIV